MLQNTEKEMLMYYPNGTCHAAISFFQLNTEPNAIIKNLL